MYVLRHVFFSFATITNIWMYMLIIVPCSKNQCFQQMPFSFGV